MSKNAVVILIIVVLFILGGWYYLKSKNASNPAQVSTQQLTPSETASSSLQASQAGEMSKNIVKIAASGFNPQNITIKAGDSVTWENGDSDNHTVNSNPHPVHTDYPPLNLGLIKPAESKSLTFPQTGTYNYHDHLNPSLTGTVTVQ